MYIPMILISVKNKIFQPLIVNRTQTLVDSQNGRITLSGDIRYFDGDEGLGFRIYRDQNGVNFLVFVTDESRFQLGEIDNAISVTYKIDDGQFSTAFIIDY